MPTRATICINTTVQQSPHQVSCELDGETVTMSIEKGIYYRMDPVGSRTWNLIANPIKVRELCRQLKSEFEVDQQQCEDDVIGFLNDLNAYHLVNIAGIEEAG